MTDDQFATLMRRFDDVDGRLNHLQADIDIEFATLTASLTSLALAQTNLFNLWAGHVNDRRAHGGTS